MMLQFPPPPGSPELPPPGPMEQTFMSLCAIAVLFGLALLALPEPWSRRILGALLKGVWPFEQLGAWLARSR